VHEFINLILHVFVVASFCERLVFL